MLCREDLSTKVKKTEDAEAEGARLELLHTSAWFSVGNKCCGRAKRFKDLHIISSLETVRLVAARLAGTKML
jgi:hypothetical protein